VSVISARNFALFLQIVEGQKIYFLTEFYI